MAIKPKSNSVTTTPNDNDPIIRIDVCHPATVAVPPKGQSASAPYTAMVTLTNTSALPLSSSSIVLTMKDNLQGYGAALLDASGKETSSLTFDLGLINPSQSASRSFKFTIDRDVDQPPPVQTGAHVQFNVMPKYEVKYSQADGFTSNAVDHISSKNPPPGTCGEWKTDPFTSDPVLSVQSSYYAISWDPQQGAGWASGDITITNTGRVPISDLKLQLEVDDDGARYTAVVVDANGAPVHQTVYDLGPLAPNKVADHTYWWESQHIEGTTYQDEDLNIEFQIMPWYCVNYANDDTFKVLVPATAGS